MAKDAVVDGRAGTGTVKLESHLLLGLFVLLCAAGAYRWLPDQWLQAGTSYGVETAEEVVVAIPGPGTDAAFRDTCTLRSGDSVAVLGWDVHRGFLVREASMPLPDDPAVACRLGTVAFVPFWRDRSHAYGRRAWVDLDAKARAAQERALARQAEHDATVASANAILAAGQH